jgi:hypothetical protein
VKPTRRDSLVDDNNDPFSITEEDESIHPYLLIPLQPTFAIYNRCKMLMTHCNTKFFYQALCRGHGSHRRAKPAVKYIALKNVIRVSTMNEESRFLEDFRNSTHAGRRKCLVFVL